mmetsp:Transcript_28403/g.82166  ORF Transcript_28403/g.82166 Transcript_28403/m.82166 type:complete len:283 (-) Transcript_28403:1242-2090(-)
MNPWKNIMICKTNRPTASKAFNTSSTQLMVPPVQTSSSVCFGSPFSAAAPSVSPFSVAAASSSSMGLTKAASSSTSGTSSYPPAFTHPLYRRMCSSGVDSSARGIRVTKGSAAPVIDVMSRATNGSTTKQKGRTMTGIDHVMNNASNATCAPSVIKSPRTQVRSDFLVGTRKYNRAGMARAELKPKNPALISSTGTPKNPMARRAARADPTNAAAARTRLHASIPRKMRKPEKPLSTTKICAIPLKADSTKRKWGASMISIGAGMAAFQYDAPRRANIITPT